MQIKFLGAAGTVTGSCYLLTSQSGDSVLIDCGLFQGPRDIERLNDFPLDGDCSQISAAILTHAHLDHCGRLPNLLPQGFKGQIWMTPPTKDITEISLFDSAKINRGDKKIVKKIVQRFQTIDYETQFKIEDFGIIMRDAGHILGSASLEIVDQKTNQKIVFSGDLGNTPEDLIKATELIGFSDIVVMESTYGDSVHPTSDPSEMIQLEINSIESSGGTLLIPAFSIERSQELLHKISHLKKAGKIKMETPIFFDSPMAQKVTEVFEKYHQYYNEELKIDFAHDDPFHFTGLTVVENKTDNKILENTNGPKIIIAGSGMMTGGKILGHAIRYLPINSTRLLIVGYQGRGTLGRSLLEGQKNVRIEGNFITVQASINQTQAMSSHADSPKLMNWLKNIKSVKKIFLTHGEDEPRKTLAEKIKTDLQIFDISLPILNQQVTL